MKRHSGLRTWQTCFFYTIRQQYLCSMKSEHNISVGAMQSHFFLKGSSLRSIAWDCFNFVRNCCIMWVIQLCFPKSTFCFPLVTLMRLFASCQLGCLSHFEKWHRNHSWHKAILLRKTLFYKLVANSTKKKNLKWFCSLNGVKAK